MANYSKILWAFLAVSPVVTAVFADEVSGVGRQFLLLPHEARESAMGGSFVSLSDNAMGVFCNPAALIQMEQSELALTHLSWFGGANEESAAFAQPLEGPGAWGLGLSFYWIQPFDNTGGAESAFSSVSYEGLAGGSVALPALAQLSAGGALKYAGMTLGPEQTHDLSVDLGLFYKADWKPLRLGVVVENVSLLTTAETYTPLTYRVGATLESKEALLAVEAERMMGQNFRFQAGGEIRLEGLALRAGISAEDTPGSFLAASFGAGFKIGNNYRLDYAASTLGDLGLVQWISMAFLFGSPEKALAKAPAPPPSPVAPRILVAAASPKLIPVPPPQTKPSAEEADEPEEEAAPEEKAAQKHLPKMAAPFHKSLNVFQKALAAAPTVKAPESPLAPTPVGGGGFPLLAIAVNDSVELSWNPPQDQGTPAAGYNVYVSMVPGAEFRKLTAKPVPETHWSVEMGLHGMTYYFKVKTVGADGKETHDSQVRDIQMP